MIVFFGSLALFFFCFLAGAFWPSRQPQEAGVLIWGLFAKSLYLSWFIFLASFLTPLGDLSRSLLILGSLAGIYMSARHPGLPVAMPGQLPFARRIGIFVCITSVVLLSGPVFNTIGTIFSDWDAIISWNRWAMELSENEYHPINAAYPILFPALWSLIYEAQQTTDVWIVAKASLVIPPIMLLALLASESLYGRIIPALFGILFVWACLLNDYSDAIDYLTSGHMDWPVAFMGCASAYLGIMAARAHDERKQNSSAIVWISVITGATAAITKQAGVMFLLASIILAVASTAPTKTGLRNLGLMLAVSITPLLSFLILFELSGDKQVIGNVEQLSGLSEIALGSDRIAGAADLLFAPIPPVFIFLLLFGCACNAFFFKRKQAQYAIVLCAFAGIGFLIFADCCSYDRRNGVWILGFLIPAALSGFEIALSKIGLIKNIITKTAPPTRKGMSATFSIVTVAALIFAIIAGAIYPDGKIKLHQEELQKHIGVEAVNAFLYANEEELHNATAIISYYQLMKYLPGFSEKFVHCNSDDIACIRRKAPLFSGHIYVFYHKGLAGRAATAYGRWIDGGRAQIVSETDKFMLIRLIK